MDKTVWKQGWRQIGETKKYYRSKWENNYACYLQYLKENKAIKDWKHESKTFWFEGLKRGTLSYLPDFLVIYHDGREEYHEVKGWLDPKSKTKLKRMAKYHPKVVIILVQKDWFKRNNKLGKTLLKGWE